MAFDLTAAEAERIRALARRQKEIADLPVMERRRQRWTALNDAVPGARPVIAIEHWTFNRDFLPPALLENTGAYARALEHRILEKIRHYEIIGDDVVCPGYFEVGWHYDHDEYGFPIPTHYAKDSEGVVTGYHFDCPIKDLDADDLSFLKPARYAVKREETQEEIDFIANLLGDILPVRLVANAPGHNCVTQRLVRLMDMETFFIGMHEAPEKVHQVMRLLTDNAIGFSRYAERENLLTLNNDNQCTCGTCYNFTTKLPAPGFDPARVRLKDLWCQMDSQETVGISPAFFAEFCFPYYREIAEMFGRVYFGCCEPIDPIWDSIGRLPNLRSVSISKWADEEKVAGLLQGRDILYSRKPDPNLLGVDVKLNEAAWKAELRKTLSLTTPRGIPTEFVVRDVYTMHGDLAKPARATALAREVIAEFHGPDDGN